jgi:hypothetical protein
MHLYSALLQIPGVDAPDMTFTEQMYFVWDEMGFMRWPLGACLAVGILVIIWKFFDLMAKSAKTKKILGEVTSS